MLALYHSFLVWLNQSKYILLFFGAIVEGPVLMMTSGFLYHLGKMNLPQMYFALLTGDFVADISWYGVGYFGAEPVVYKYGKFLGINPRIVLKLEHLFKKYHERILIISKLTMGFGFAIATLVTAGLFRVDFKKYVVLNLLGGFLWTAFLITIGYFFGNIFTLVPDYLKGVFIGAALIGAFIALKLISNKLKEIEY